MLGLLIVRPATCVQVVVVALLAMLAVSQPAQGQDADQFTIAVVPDTQIYVQSDSGTAFFADQFEWIVAQRSERNIVFATHVGDVSQNPSSTTEWDRIETVYEALDDAQIPYGISPGNHDINADATAPEYDARFGVARYAGRSWFGGNHVDEGNRSSFQRVSIDGHDLLFVHVRHLQPAYGNVEALLDWTDAVLRDHPDHLTFVTTHEFTDNDGTVRFPALQALIESHCTVAAVFSGHRTGGSARGSFTDSCDRTVHHVLSNYQTFANGGQGYLRTVEIDRLTLEASFQVYSPTLDQFRTGPSESFVAPLAPLPLVAGDVSCNRRISVADALFVAQYSVGLRTARTTCPLVDPSVEANIAGADVNGDGRISVTDAILIAQCSAQLPNVFCPG